jgi:hypothetical protein
VTIPPVDAGASGGTGASGALVGEAETTEAVPVPPGFRRAAPAVQPEPSERDGWWAAPLSTFVAVAGVIAVVLWQTHLPLILSGGTTTGGDTGAHYMMPAFFNTHLFPHLTGWDPDWYDGYPAYTFYFVLPDALVALASHVISYNVAFKLATLLGSVLLPVAAWACGRLFGFRAPIPAALAVATLPFLFDYTWTIYGGNLFSTLAGEYSYSLSVALLVLFLGLFARGVRTGRHRVWSAVVLALCILSHVVPGAMAIAGAIVLTIVELVPGIRLSDAPAPGPRAQAGGTGTPARRAGPSRPGVLWWGASTVGLGLLLCAWWIVPFVVRQTYATSMNYTKVTTYVTLLFPKADLWALALAAVAVVVAVATRSRFGVVAAFLGGLSALAVVVDPDRSLYNVRFLPLWFLSVYLLAGWVCGVALAAVAGRARRERARAALATVAGPLVALVAALAVVVPPFVPALASALPQIGIHPGANQVSVWAQWNYSGYEGKADYPEYRGLMELMRRVGRAHGCGRAMWEYSADENRFGTPEALMLLPYWTTGCIDSMEGLLFESSATTPYHFLNQAELSESPSEAVVGLPYGPVTVRLGVEHLQLLGVRYFMAASPEVEQQADSDPTLELLATSGPWRSTYQGERLTTTWKVYEVLHSSIVEPLTHAPAVLRGVGQGQTTWLGRIGSGTSMSDGPSLRWYLDPAAWDVELVADGRRSWPRVTAAEATDPPVVAVRSATVSQVRVGASSVSFHVSRIGTPVLVKVSYFPNWHASGAEGPWRATPNLMVVVPTSRDVVLTYGTTDVTEAGDLATAVGAAIVVVLGGWWFARRWRRRARVG